MRKVYFYLKFFYSDIYNPIFCVQFVMSALYIHIPFCKSRCVYCDFCSTTNINLKNDYLNVLCEELTFRRDYLKNESFYSVYFGGGTPSLLTPKDFEKIFQSLTDNHYYNKKEHCEITLEANPDHITFQYLTSLHLFPFNRISLGVQSFHSEELKFLGRQHSALHSINSVKHLQIAGYENISIDLIYGIPNQTLQSWIQSINTAIALKVPHISAYHLTYEKNTRLSQALQSGHFKPLNEEKSRAMFEILVDKLISAGFEHYEISNFAQPNYYSRHNSTYWNGNCYLGVGVSAHSYNGITRQWNTMNEGNIINYSPHMEIIDEKTAYNDFIITRLRTIQGIDLRELILLHGEEKKAYCLYQANKYIANQLMEIFSNHLRLTRKGLFVSDGVICDLLS